MSRTPGPAAVSHDMVAVLAIAVCAVALAPGDPLATQFTAQI